MEFKIEISGSTTIFDFCEEVCEYAQTHSSFINTIGCNQSNSLREANLALKVLNRELRVLSMTTHSNQNPVHYKEYIIDTNNTAYQLIEITHDTARFTQSTPLGAEVIYEVKPGVWADPDAVHSIPYIRHGINLAAADTLFVSRNKHTKKTYVDIAYPENTIPRSGYFLRKGSDVLTRQVRTNAIYNTNFV